MGLLERMTRGVRPVLTRDVEPLEGTNMSLWNSTIPNWWTENGMNAAGQMFWPGNGLLADRTWITNRCLQMNSQQIGSMPLRFEAPNVTAGPQSVEPAWVSNPDPLYYPNGVSSLIRALTRDYYGWGYCLLYVTSRYANGYPRTFTRIPASRCEPRWNAEGVKEYALGDDYLDPNEIIQIDRDCGDGWLAHGQSAIWSYAQMAWGLQAAGNQAMEVNTGGVPKAVLKVTDPNRKLDSTQAENLQTQWQTRTQARGGAPPVMQYGLDFETLGWSPKDMALLETQDFNALALATAFGIPAVLINMTVGGGRGNSALTYQTPAMVGDQWWRYELRPTAKAMADALSSQALPAGQWVWFDASDTFLPYEPQNPAPAEGLTADTKDDAEAASEVTSAVPPAASASPTQLSVVEGGGVTR
jgi:hypothetical protein